MRSSLFYSFLLFLVTFFGCSSLNPDEKEINKLAAQAYQQVKQEAKVSSNAEWREMLNRVAPRIAAASGVDFDWEWMLIESPEMNAWCMPGGKMAVYTGIMPVLQTEAALAAVLGHEVAHATLRHGKERYARAVKANLAGVGIGVATSVGGQLLCPNETCRLLTGLGGAAASFALTFFDRKFSREDELEADKLGQMYMAKAGYVPTAAIGVWERMSEANKGPTPPEIISTHPSDQRRQTLLKEWLPKAMEVYEDAPKKFGLGEKIN